MKRAFHEGEPHGMRRHNLDQSSDFSEVVSATHYNSTDNVNWKVNVFRWMSVG